VMTSEIYCIYRLYSRTSQASDAGVYLLTA